MTAQEAPMTQRQPNPQDHGDVHVNFLLDRSGSMGRIRDDVIGGFNHFLREQQARAGTCRMTLAQFDTQEPFEVLVDAEDVKDVPLLDAGRYAPRGGTPLLDALGTLLEHAERRARGRDEDAVVVVFTDGQENASHRWTREALFERIAALKARGWSFVFLGANQDSYAQAGALGFAPGSTSNWDVCDSSTAFAQTSRAVLSLRGKMRGARAAQSEDFFEGVKEAEASGSDGSARAATKVKH
jgi:hypothetical protein